MLYYSEKLNSFFNTEKELLVAEKEADEKEKEEAEKEKAARLAKKKEQREISAEKKRLSKAIEEADVAIETAKENYCKAQEEATKITEEAQQKINELLTPAKTAINNAHEQKFKLLSEFNKKFGSYTITYTGDKAYNEFKRATDWINDIFNILW